MRVKTESGKDKDVDILNITPSNYVCPEREKHLYHCKIEVVEYSKKDGSKLSKPRIQKFGKKSFENFMLHELRQQGYTIEILHKPETITEESKKAKEDSEYLKMKEKIKAEVIAELEANNNPDDKVKVKGKGKNKDVSDLKDEETKE